MRIGLISGEYPPMRGGIGDYTRELAQALAAAGHDISILTDCRAKVDDSHSDFTITPIINRWDWRSGSQIRQWSRDCTLDVVNIQYETAAYGMSAAIHLLPRFVTMPTITTFHDLRVPYLFPKAGKVREQALWLLARQSLGVIATDSADADRLGKMVPRTSITQIPIGSNIPTTPPTDFDRTLWREAHAVTPNTCLIGYFGFMNANKGLEILIDSLAQAVQTGVDARLVMIGGGATESDLNAAAYAETIRARIDSAGLTGRVQWTGFITPEEVSTWLLACDVVALPFTDGVSLRRGSFLAALAHGCTILTTPPQTNVPGINAVAAFVPANAPDAMARELSALAGDAKRRQSLGEAAKAFAQQFSWSAIAAQTADFYAAQLQSFK
jgi:glycosyltransferase involved in cell wall biosynthesis